MAVFSFVSRETVATRPISAPARSIVAGSTHRPVMSGHRWISVPDRDAVDQRLVGAGGSLRVFDAERRGRVALRVHVDDENGQPARAPAPAATFTARRGLTDATLLVGDDHRARPRAGRGSVGTVSRETSIRRSSGLSGAVVANSSTSNAARRGFVVKSQLTFVGERSPDSLSRQTRTATRRPPRRGTRGGLGRRRAAPSDHPHRPPPEQTRTEGGAAPATRREARATRHPRHPTRRHPPPPTRKEASATHLFL